MKKARDRLGRQPTSYDLEKIINKKYINWISFTK